jgi:hypothetical protein
VTNKKPHVCKGLVDVVIKEYERGDICLSEID